MSWHTSVTDAFACYSTGTALTPLCQSLTGATGALHLALDNILMSQCTASGGGFIAVTPSSHAGPDVATLAVLTGHVASSLLGGDVRIGFRSRDGECPSHQERKSDGGDGYGKDHRRRLKPQFELTLLTYSGEV